MSKKEPVNQPAHPIDETDHSHPMIPVILVSVLALAIIALALRAFGVF